MHVSNLSNIAKYFRLMFTKSGAMQVKLPLINAINIQ